MRVRAVGILLRRVGQCLLGHHGFDGLVDAIIFFDARQIPLHHLGDGVFAIRVKLLTDVGRHAGQELVSVDRAREVVVDAEFEPAKNFRAIVGISNDEDWQSARTLMRSDPAAQSQAVEGARTETDDHEVDERFARHSRRFARVVSEDHIVIRA